MGKWSRRRRLFWALSGFLFTALLGTLLHFLWEWTGRSPLTAAFSAVNESVWEHMKLLFLPMFLFSMVELWFQDEPGFLAVRGLSAVFGTVLIPTLYYTYSGAVGRHVLWADILVFLLSAAAAFALDSALRRTGRLTSGWQQAAGLAALWALALLFVLWSYRPPHLAVFQDPSTGLFGPSV